MERVGGQPRSRPALALVVALLLGAGCASAEPSASLAGGSSPSASAEGSEQALVPSPRAPSPAAAYWETVGSMKMGRIDARAIPLGDDGVLVVGNDDRDPDDFGYLGCSIDDRAEQWDPASGQWTPVLNLPKARGRFAAVPLADGQALITGGANAEGVSFSSTYIFDPLTANWRSTGLLGTARTEPAAAVLQDGRVLIAGGYYLDASRASSDTAEFARFEPQAGDDARVPLANIDPIHFAPALATAELYDPSTRTWSPTGALVYARARAGAATLADGRVLIVGPPVDNVLRAQDYWMVPIDANASRTTEVYDPGTGRFSLAGELPPVDYASLAGLDLDDPSDVVEAMGSLVALPDGDALLVGRTMSWSAYASTPGADGHYVARGEAYQTLRFLAREGRWVQLDRSLTGRVADDDQVPVFVAGHTRSGSVVAVLSSRAVLVAGGRDLAAGPIATAELYDPVANTWSPLPAMPEARAWGSSVVLADGSLLVLGGTSERGPATGCHFEGPTGLASVVRFVLR